MKCPVILLLSAAAALAFAKGEELERKDAPPAKYLPIFTSPGRTIYGNGGNSVQVNVNANGANILGDAANEPSLWIDPTNPLHIAVGWRQFDSVTSNFRQAGNAWSDDGGLTWHNRPVLEPNVFRSDPVLGGTAEGTFYYLSLKETFFDDLWKSLSGGASYTNIGPATGGDKQWFTVDPTNSSGHGFIYQIWSTAGNNYNGRQFSRSTDNGATWMNPINLPNRPVWGTLDCGPNGELYITGTDNSLPSMRFLRSSNAKNSGVTPTFDLSVYVNLGGDITNGLPINPGGLGGQAWIAADRGNGPTRGNIYILCSVGGTGGNPLDVKFRRSTNGGSTWDPAVRINDDPTGQNRYHWFGTLSVAPNGRLDAVWNDTREDPTNQTSRLYHSHSYNGGLTWSTNVPIGPSFNQSLGYPQQNKMGDYLGMISNNADACIAYAATYNGEQDVYFLRYTPPCEDVFFTGFQVTSGTHFSGDAQSLAFSDDNPLCVLPDDTTGRTEVTLTASSPFAAPTKLGFTVDMSATRLGLVQTLEWFNVQTQAWDLIDGRIASPTDLVFTKEVVSNPRSYVANVALNARIATQPVNDEDPSADGWLTCIDQAYWQVCE